MPSDDPSGSRPASPIVLRIKLRYDNIEAMVQRFAVNVGKSGMFLPTKSLQPIGTEVKFELRLANDAPVLVGLGRVKAVNPPDPLHPQATFGMAIELMRVTPQSRALILRMLERRRELGLPELGLPMAADIDAGRQVEALHAGVTEQTPVVTPGLMFESPGAEALMTAPRRASGRVEGRLDGRGDGRSDASTVPAVAPLLPEPQRRKRLAMSEVIESASGAIVSASASASVPGLDDDVDVAAAIVRARALTGGGGQGLDAELDALAEEAAAPIEISIEAASAELARQLGGNAVRRDRSARWMTPPATTTMTAVAAADPELHRETEGDTLSEPQGGFAYPDLEPMQRAESVQPLDDFDLEEVEHTELGIVPARAPATNHVMLAARRAAEAEAAAEVPAEVEAEAGAAPDALVLADEPAHDVSLEEIDDFEILAEADVDVGAGDDSARHSAVSDSQRVRRPRRTSRTGGIDRHADSAGHALAAFETDDSLGETSERLRGELGGAVQPIFETESSNSFTLAGVLSDSLDLDAPSSSMQPMAAYPEPELQRTPPAAQRRPAKASPSLYDSPVEDHELEHALEALDVDLDDLSIPHADTHLQRGLGPSPLRSSRSSNQGSMIRPSTVTRTTSPVRVVASRPPSDDDVAIEFEEED